VTRLRAYAKLTLSLRVVGVRPDGYHELDAEMVSVDLADDLDVDERGDGLEIVAAADAADAAAAAAAPIDGTVGDTVGDAVDDNLVTRALRLAGRRAFVRVHKRIPAGAGLGGGSSDAAAILRWAGWRDVAGAAQLGADVPFCLVGGRARVRGIGEVVEPLPFRAGELTLLTPPVHCSTPAVYRAWDELGHPEGPHGNDLEPAALVVAPVLARYRDRLGDETGQTPRLAGSGSTWFVEGAHPGPDRVVVRTVPAS
jgi:4-diphosphocytidyl-2-C-methyl-D-erythritol kinase